MTALALLAVLVPGPTLESVWESPPNEAKIRAYWWWLNGNVTKVSITRDLESMRDKGLGGAILCDANGTEQEGNAPVPHGPDFASAAWRELYRHTLCEADRLELEISLNIQSGWNLGAGGGRGEEARLIGVRVRRRSGGWEAARAEARRSLLSGPVRAGLSGSFRLCAPTGRALGGKIAPAGARVAGAGTSALLADVPAIAGEAAVAPEAVVDLTGKTGRGGTLRWTPSKGAWRVFRIGCTVGDYAKVSTSSDGWKGYALDPYDEGAFRHY